MAGNIADAVAKVGTDPNSKQIVQVQLLDATGAPDPGTSVITTPTASTVNVTATTALALAANTNRVYAIFVNDGANAIWLMPGAAAVAHTGILLNPGGGAYEIYGGNLYRGAFNVIAAVAGPTVLMVVEGV